MRPKLESPQYKEIQAWQHTSTLMMRWEVEIGKLLKAHGPATLEYEVENTKIDLVSNNMKEKEEQKFHSDLYVHTLAQAHVHKQTN